MTPQLRVAAFAAALLAVVPQVAVEACKDPADWVDEKGFHCSAWKGYKCDFDDGKKYGYSPEGLVAVRVNCRCACGAATDLRGAPRVDELNTTASLAAEVNSADPAIKVDSSSVELDSAVAGQGFSIVNMSAQVVRTEMGVDMNRSQVSEVLLRTGSLGTSDCRYLLWHTGEVDCNNLYPKFSSRYAAKTYSGVNNAETCVYASSETCLGYGRFKMVGAMDFVQCQRQAVIRGYSDACFEVATGLCVLTKGERSFGDTTLTLSCL